MLFIVAFLIVLSSAYKDVIIKAIESFENPYTY